MEATETAVMEKTLKGLFKIEILSEFLLVLRVDFLQVVIHDCHPVTVLTPDQRWLMAVGWPVRTNIMVMNKLDALEGFPSDDGQVCCDYLFQTLQKKYLQPSVLSHQLVQPKVVLIYSIYCGCKL